MTITTTEPTNRETWLQLAVLALTPWFKELGHEVPAVHVSVGWPTGSRSVIGQCWPPTTSDDGVGHVFITPAIADPMDVLGVLIHEVVHAVLHVDGISGHGKDFAAIAKPLGLVGKMTSTTVGDELRERLQTVADELGAYPHARLNRHDKTAAVGRSGKLVTLECQAGEDFKVSIAKTRLANYGAPKCPCHDEEMYPA